MRVFAIIMFVLSPSSQFVRWSEGKAVQTRLSSYIVQNDAQLLRDSIAEIPDAASVAAPTTALPALSKRDKLFYLQYLYMYHITMHDHITFLLIGTLNMLQEIQICVYAVIQLLTEMFQSTEYKTILWRQGGDNIPCSFMFVSGMMFV